MINLTKEQIKRFPIHDSEFHGIEVLQDQGGVSELQLEFLLHSDEVESANDVLNTEKHFSEKSLMCFQNLWWSSYTGFFNCSNRDIVDGIAIVENSPIVQKQTAVVELNHFVIEFISGSKLECVCEKVCLS